MKNLLMIAGSGALLLSCLGFVAKPKMLVQPPRLLPPQKPIPLFPWPTLPQIRDHGPASAIQDHAWNLLLQLSQPWQHRPADRPYIKSNGHPLWESWYTKCSQLQLSAVCDGPPQMLVPAGAGGSRLEGTVNHAVAPITPQLSTVYYSPDAAEWILDNRLNDGRILLQGLLNSKVSAQQPSVSVPPFPPSSIVIKEIWWPLNPTAQGKWILPVHDPRLSLNDPATSGLPFVNTWKSQIFLKSISDQRGNKVLDFRSRCPHALADPPFDQSYLGRTIPANCFTYRYAPRQCRDIFPITLADQNQYLSIRLLEPCVVVLMGVEIITKESLANWSWSTFWWTDNPGSIGNWKPRTLPLREEFVNFAMRTLLAPENDNDPVAPIYNPYLEGPTKNGPSGNCLECHSKAAYIPNAKAKPGDPRSGVGFFDPDNPANNCTQDQLKNPAANRCGLHTSLLWSLATAQDRTVPAPMVMLQNQ